MTDRRTALARPGRDEPARSSRSGQASSGAFVAGPTFSQYGYCWFRDGAFIAEALDKVGRTEWAARFHRWVAGVDARVRRRPGAGA